MRAAFAVLNLTPGKRRIAVLGDMLELGDHAKSEHTALAAALSESADIVHACGHWMRFLFEAIPAAKQGVFAPDSAALAPSVIRDLREGDVILVKGSLGSRMQKIVHALDTAGPA